MSRFGEHLRQLRSARGLSCDALGVLVNYSGAYIWDLETGRRAARPDLAAVLDTALNARGELAALAASHPSDAIDTPWTVQAAHEILDRVVDPALMDRRGFLALSGTALTGLALTWSATQPAPLTITANGWLTPDAVDHLHARVEELWHLDDVLGGGGCLDAGIADLRLVGRLIRHGRYDAAVGQRLHSLAAALARFCGFAAFDAGHDALAQRFWHAGLRAAATVGDVDQGVYVLSNLALQAAYRDDGATAVALLDVARRKVDPAARTVLAMLDCWAVRGHALVGEAKTAAGLLNRADEQWDRRRAEDDPPWVYWMPQPSLTAEAGTALMDIGDLAAAERSLLAGLSTLDVGSPRDRHLYLVRLAEVRLRGGRLDEAVATARLAIGAAGGVDSARVRSRMDALLDAMPAGEPLVQRLCDWRREETP